jgi:phospholipid:diacylglycerol acyltransferase
LKYYSFGIAHSRKQVEENQKIPRKWSNPLETRLPKAPNMKIYCFYGIGKPTERAYYYREDNEPASENNVMLDTSASFQNPDSDHIADRGVVMGEGDGTVNLLSTGYMCNKGWRMKRYNPSGIKITTYEMPHKPDMFSPRGGPNTGESFFFFFFFFFLLSPFFLPYNFFFFSCFILFFFPRSLTVYRDYQAIMWISWVVHLSTI